MPKRETDQVAIAKQDFSKVGVLIQDGQAWLKTKSIKSVEVAIVGAHLAELKDLRKKLEDKRKGYVDPLNKVVRKINAEAKPFRDQIDELIDHEHALLTDFESKEKDKARKRAEKEAAKLRAKGADQMADQLLKEAENSARIDVAGLQTRSMRSYEVTNLRELCAAVADGRVPLDAVSENSKFFNAAAKMSEDSPYPGVAFVTKTILAKGA